MLTDSHSHTATQSPAARAATTVRASDIPMLPDTGLSGDDFVLSISPVVTPAGKRLGLRASVRPAAAGNARGATVSSALSYALPLVSGIQSPSVFLSTPDSSFDADCRALSVPSNVIVEVGAAATARPITAETVKAMGSKGVRFALRGRSEPPVAADILRYVTHAFIHVQEDRRIPVGLQRGPIPERRIPFVSRGASTYIDVRAAFERGAIGSAGWPLSDPLVRSTKPLQPGQAAVLDAMRLIRADAEIHEVEASLKRDPALSYKLLKFVNSASIGLPEKITSFRGAVMMLGYKRLLRWLVLLAVSSTRDPVTSPVAAAAIQRGLLMEMLAAGPIAEDEPASAARARSALRDDMFIAGTFSLLDRITGASHETLFDSVSISADVRSAITAGTGPISRYLGLAQAAELGDCATIEALLGELGISGATYNECVAKATAVCLEYVE